MLDGVDLIPERCPHRWASPETWPSVAGNQRRCVGLADEPHNPHWWTSEEQAFWTRLVRERFIGAMDDPPGTAERW